MSKSDTLNNLYNSYRPSTAEIRPEYLEPLLAEIFKTAQRYFYDDDAAQEFTIALWRELKDIEIKKSFAAYLHSRMTCDRFDMYRRQARNPEKQIPRKLGADGEPFSDTEALDIEQYRNRVRAPSHAEKAAPDIDELMESIEDPLIRRVAELIRQKKTIKACAEILETPPATLRKRLERYRKRNTKKVAA